MRYLDAGLCFLLMLFTIVQYNDPDAPPWIIIYGLPVAMGGGLPTVPARSPRTDGSKCLG